MTKHCERTLFVLMKIPLSLVVTFGVLCLPQLIETGRSPPNQYTVQKPNPNFGKFAEILFPNP